MTREEYEFNYNKLQLTGKDAISRLYIKSLEAKIAELEYQLEDNGTRAEEIISSREKHIEILHNHIAELEAQNKALTDMVEMQSEKISRLEAPKDCEGCKYSDVNGYPDYDMCERCVRIACDYYEPKKE